MCAFPLFVVVSNQSYPRCGYLSADISRAEKLEYFLYGSLAYITIMVELKTMHTYTQAHHRGVSGWLTSPEWQWH